MNWKLTSPAPFRLCLRLVVFVIFCLSFDCVHAAVRDKTYRVRRGDTLSGIAHTHRIPVPRLAEYNRISPNTRLSVGQQLKIPEPPKKLVTKARVSSPVSRPSLPSTIARAIAHAPVRPGRWQHIVIHHSGVNSGTLAGMDRYHRNVRHMENGLAYHFVIGNAHGLGDGEVGIGARWTKQLDGGHLISDEQNKVSIGICLVGNFEEASPTPRQMERLTALVRALMARCRLSPSSVKTHQQINVVHTRCPGRNFPLQTLLNALGR